MPGGLCILLRRLAGGESGSWQRTEAAAGGPRPARTARLLPPVLSKSAKAGKQCRKHAPLYTCTAHSTALRCIKHSTGQPGLARPSMAQYVVSRWPCTHLGKHKVCFPIPYHMFQASHLLTRPQQGYIVGGCMLSADPQRYRSHALHCWSQAYLGLQTIPGQYDI